MKRAMAVCFALLIPGAHLEAHDPGLSSMSTRLQRGRIVTTVSMARTESPRLGEPGALVRISLDGSPLALSELEVETDGEDGVHFRFVHERVDPGRGRLTIDAAFLDDLPRGHRVYATVVGDGSKTIATVVLDRGRRTLEVALDSLPSAVSAPFESFVRLGVEHILEGYDHLLFLLALLIGGGGFRSIVRVATAFTVAHSLTLALGASALFTVPGGVVEPLIAASIVYVGIHNLVSGSPRHRAGVTFVFGLVHGLGFASVLTELGLAGGIGGALSLLGFNLGVELGQLAVVALALPLVWRAREHRLALSFASLAVTAAGGTWLVVRVLYP